MHGRTTEGSPLLGAAATPMRGWGNAGREGSGRALLGEGRDSSRRRNRDGGPVSSNLFRRNWKVSAGVAGLLMFSMALAGLVAIFSTIQSERTPRSASPQAQLEDAEVASPAVKSTAPAGSNERCERDGVFFFFFFKRDRRVSAKWRSTFFGLCCCAKGCFSQSQAVRLDCARRSFDRLQREAREETFYPRHRGLDSRHGIMSEHASMAVTHRYKKRPLHAITNHSHL